MAEESPQKMKDSFETAQELQEATVQVLSSSTDATTLSSAAVSIASNYIAIGQSQNVRELSDEVYCQVIMKDMSSSKSVKFNLSSREHHGLIFLAQLQHCLRPGASSVSEILASLTTEYAYFEEFRKQLKSPNSTVQSTSLPASQLYHILVANHRQAAADRVFEEFKSHFLCTEGKQIELTESAQAEVFLRTILSYLRTNRRQDFTRCIGEVGNTRVVELLREQEYISSQENYHTPGIVKYIFTLGMNISGRGLVPQPLDTATQKQLYSISGLIIEDALRVIRDLELNLARIDLDELNNLVDLLGKQRLFKSLAWLLTALWDSHEVQDTWKPNATFAVAYRVILASYFIGDVIKAARLAEDIAYNFRRVHGAHHSYTLQISVLLSQIHIGAAMQLQSLKGGQHMAQRLYKKSAAVHENILRAFVDLFLADREIGLDIVNPGGHVRQHLKLLKLSIQRLGNWPKDYIEYERLDADLFCTFPKELQGVEGVDKWDLTLFGNGKAESEDDMLDLESIDWRLFPSS